MSTRRFAFAVVFLSLAACVNEPFTLLPLGVTDFSNTSAGVTNLYTYRKGKVQTYLKSNSQGPITSMKFKYDGDVLMTIIKDSTESGYGLVKVSREGVDTEIDSIFAITATRTTLVEVRILTYTQGRPSRIEVLTWSGADISEAAYELDWVTGNASEVRTMGVVDGDEVVTHVLGLTYDDQKGVFSSDVPYVYTLPPDELYWMSANNPVRFKRDTLDEVKYTYHYNLKGYPGHIITDKRQVLAISYTELR